MFEQKGGVPKMMGTFNCVYETPCGWCSKWDKKCDKVAGKPMVATMPLSSVMRNEYVKTYKHMFETKE